MRQKQPYFPWTADLSVGIDEIDAQHKLLVEIINRASEALIERASRDIAGQILEDLVQYTFVHFAVEESLFRITDYPGYDEHKAEHERLKREVFDIRRAFARGEVELDLNLLFILRQWLETHIKDEDRRYIGHLLKAGIKARWERPGWVGRIWQNLRT